MTPRSSRSGGRGSAPYVVAEQDATVFTLGRWPDDPGKRQRFADLADRLDAFLAGRTMTYSEAGHALGMNPNSLALRDDHGPRAHPLGGSPPAAHLDGAATGDRAGANALLELARRYLHIFGPTNAGPFGEWAGIRTPRPARAFEALADSLIPVRTPLGDAWILDADERAFREPDAPPAGVRLLPSGDTYYLLWGRDRELLVPDASRRSLLWTSRVWPGAVLVRGEVVGTLATVRRGRDDRALARAH